MITLVFEQRRQKAADRIPKISMSNSLWRVYAAWNPIVLARKLRDGYET